jgi:hypothetical protein
MRWASPSWCRAAHDPAGQDAGALNVKCSKAVVTTIRRTARRRGFRDSAENPHLRGLQLRVTKDSISRIVMETAPREARKKS